MYWIHASRAIIGDGVTVISPVWMCIDKQWITRITNSKPDKIDNLKTIELGDVTLTPGLMNIHDHISRKSLRVPDRTTAFGATTAAFMSQDDTALILHSANNMRKYLLKEGITWVRDYGLAGLTSITLNKAINEGIAIGPEIDACAEPICITGGHCYKQSYQADGVSEVIKAVRIQVERGATIIKFMCSGGLEHYPREVPSNTEFLLEELIAGVKTAKEFGLPTAIHAYSHEAIKRGITAGVDNIEHGALMSENQAKTMAEKNINFNPTMSGLRAAFSTGPNRQYWDKLTEDIYSKQENIMRKAKKYGVLIGAGTDSLGFISDEIRMIGETLNETPVEALAHATSINAKIARRNDLGLLQEGKRANIAAFPGDLSLSLDPLSKGSVMTFKDGIAYRGLESNEVYPLLDS